MSWEVTESSAGCESSSRFYPKDGAYSEVRFYGKYWLRPMNWEGAEMVWKGLIYLGATILVKGFLFIFVYISCICFYFTIPNIHIDITNEELTNVYVWILTYVPWMHLTSTNIKDRLICISYQTYSQRWGNSSQTHSDYTHTLKHTGILNTLQLASQCTASHGKDVNIKTTREPMTGRVPYYRIKEPRAFMVYYCLRLQWFMPPLCFSHTLLGAPGSPSEPSN